MNETKREKEGGLEFVDCFFKTSKEEVADCGVAGRQKDKESGFTHGGRDRQRSRHGMG